MRKKLVCILAVLMLLFTLNVQLVLAEETEQTEQVGSPPMYTEFDQLEGKIFGLPTSALDPEMVSEVISVMRNLADSGLTMLVVTHDMRLARDLTTRIFFMDQGGIYEDGTPEQIFTNPLKERTRQFVFQESKSNK